MDVKGFSLRLVQRVDEFNGITLVQFVPRDASFDPTNWRASCLTWMSREEQKVHLFEAKLYRRQAQAIVGAYTSRLAYGKLKATPAAPLHRTDV